MSNINSTSSFVDVREYLMQVNDMNIIDDDFEIRLFFDWLYDGEGGYVSHQWDETKNSLGEQAEKIQRAIYEYPNYVD